jgi:Raf kinase inhibitor-like YbhB/YbcL family protein
LTDTDFTLSSPAFADGQPIPVRFTCDGEDVSPQLAWESAPPDTASMALIVDDPDARGFTHWVLYDLDGARTGAVPEGISASPDAPPQGGNDFGRIGWGGPCPPAGRPHRYRFRLFALTEPLGLTGTPTADDVLVAAEGRVLASAELIGTYERRR